MCEVKKVYDLARQSLENIKNSVKDGELTDEQIIEFYETFKHDIVEMLDVKIEKLKVIELPVSL